jgi:hypothetical protein
MRHMAEIMIKGLAIPEITRLYSYFRQIFVDNVPSLWNCLEQKKAKKGDGGINN